MSKKITEISAGSMADIAFLLLIFFLVTTTMDVDVGITRILPPPLQDSIKIIVERRNLMNIWINKSDRIQVNENEVQVEDIRQLVAEFLANDDFRIEETPPSMPEKKPKAIPLLGQQVYVSKGIISLKNDRGTSYEMYVRVQNELAAAINKLREDFSEKQFGIRYSQLSDEAKLKAVQKQFPMAISEAEPAIIGGN
ncbi:MAG: biopolymer transporter ExbD [Bacteroidales bacterium]|nr:biopolymer transporter ExbD [Bacteroidales bacterium]